MSRADALQKLLALGELPRPEIEQVMGGDRRETGEAMEQLRCSGGLTYRNDGYGQRLYVLTEAGRATAFQGAA